ncbi:MAG: class I mannose-6-phosphate isomerase [Bacteroidales bacterium]|nr:class I mannose-6-phosphate isomerase [Bacteroidales bacterium]
MEKKLYPLTFIPDQGVEDAVVKEGWLEGSTVADIMETYLDRLVGEKIYNYYGRQFPVSVRLLRPEGRLPLMVTPSDSIAEARFDSLGKAKLWYVISAGPDSGINLGFKEDVSAADLYKGCLDGSIETRLNKVQVKAGNCFYIGPGDVHSAWGDLCMLEVSEASPLDFKLWDWGREIAPDELGVIDAIDFVNLSAIVPEDCSHHDKLAQKDEFMVTRLDLKDALHIYSEKFDSFLLYYCLEGEASFQVKEDGGVTRSYMAKKGECMLVPAEIPDFLLVPTEQNTVLVETYVVRDDVPDQYINPSASATPENAEPDLE